MPTNSGMLPPSTVIGFIGAGNMAEAIVRGILANGCVFPPQVIMSDIRADATNRLARELAIVPGYSNRQVLEEATVIVLAIKPQTLPQVLDELREHAQSHHLFVSILAGTRIDRLEKGLAHALCPKPRVVRAMPNTPALIRKGATAIAPGSQADEDDVAVARTLFDAVGVTAILEERHMDAVTGLTGSGPAYIFRMIEALIEAGIEQGLPAEATTKLVKAMVAGAGAMAAESTETPATLRIRVTSPGGTTAAGLTHMENYRFNILVRGAVAAATRRSEELAQM